MNTSPLLAYSIGKLQKIEEERSRLKELKREAAEKAELEWNERKKEEEKRELEEEEIKVKKVQCFILPKPFLAFLP